MLTGLSTSSRQERSQSSEASRLLKKRSLPCKPKSIPSCPIRRNLIQQVASPMEMGRRTASKDTRKARGKASQEVMIFQHGSVFNPRKERRSSTSVDGKDYHWCPNHNRWTRHRLSECKGISFKGAPKKKQGNKSQDSKPNMKLAKALAAISEDEV